MNKAEKIARVWRKPCRKCGVAKPLTEFYRNRRARDGRESACRECRKAYMREYNARPEVVAARAAYAVDYYADPANRAANIERTRRRQDADPDGRRAYAVAHNRVKYHRGSAKDYWCAHPGCPDQAYGWALDTSHPTVQRSALYTWSDEIDAYRPMCHSHNTREDAERRRAEAA